MSDEPPVSVTKNRTFVFRLNAKHQGAMARWLGRAIAAGVGAAVYQLARYLIGW